MSRRGCSRERQHLYAVDSDDSQRPLADARSELVRLAPPDPAFTTQVWILTHPDLRQVARIRAFTQFLFDALSMDVRLAH